MSGRITTGDCINSGENSVSEMVGLEVRPWWDERQVHENSTEILGWRVLKDDRYVTCWNEVWAGS